MTEFGWGGQPRAELTYEQREKIANAVEEWARSLPRSTPLFQFLGGSIASAGDVARVAALRPGDGRRGSRSLRQLLRGGTDERLYDYMLNLFAVALTEYDFESLLDQFAVAKRGSGPTAPGPSAEPI